MKVVWAAFKVGISIQSDFARKNAQLVAVAASMGLITTFESEGFGRKWRPTSKGLFEINEGVLSQ